jgi:voltage-gated potassium channel
VPKRTVSSGSMDDGQIGLSTPTSRAPGRLRRSRVLVIVPERGTVTAFVSAHQVLWEVAMALLALSYIGLLVLNEQRPDSVPGWFLVVLPVVFAAEFFLRLWDAPSRRVYLRGHWVDVATCIPTVGALRTLRLLRLIRLFGLARLTHVAEEIDHDAHEGPWLVAAGLAVLWFSSAYAMWTLEHGVNRHIDNFGDALVWSFLTVTTLGYGSIPPVTTSGKLLTGVMVFLGVGLVGAASSRLTAVWLRVGQDDIKISDIRALRDDLARTRALLESTGVAAQSSGPRPESPELDSSNPPSLS